MLAAAVEGRLWTTGQLGDRASSPTPVRFDPNDRPPKGTPLSEDTGTSKAGDFPQRQLPYSIINGGIANCTVCSEGPALPFC